jgi:hypothetical protein
MGYKPGIDLTAAQERVVYLRDIEGLSWRKIGQRLDMPSHGNVIRVYQAAKKKLAAQGYSPEHDMTKTVPEGFHVQGVSTLYDQNGQVRAQWVKSQADREREQELLKAFVEGLNSEIKPARRKPLKRSAKYDPDLMSAILIGDAHIGMKAFGVETKHHDFDTKIATTQLREACDYLLERAPDARTGLLVNVGDLMHANTQRNETVSGTPLDVDTRHYRVMKAAAETMQYMVDRMLAKFRNVIVVMARGNHDSDAAGALQLMLEFYYHKEPRVTVPATDGYYHYLEYGRWLLGIHHGDKQKPEQLAASMARDMPEAWGRTTHRLWLTGHYHKEQTKTLPGVRHKVCGALPPPDSWHAAHGFQGDGEMEMMTFNRQGGLHSSYVYNVPQPRVEPDVKID